MARLGTSISDNCYAGLLRTRRKYLADEIHIVEIVRKKNVDRRVNE